MIDINSLVSGFHPSLAMASGLRIAVITVLVWVAIAFSHRQIGPLRIAYSNTLDNPEDVKWITTLVRVFRYMASVEFSLIHDEQNSDR